MSLEVLRKKNTWIQKTPDVCGGDACIRDTRITVWGLVEWKQLGLTEPEIISRIQGLTAADLEAAWVYYEKNRGEIEQAIRENEEA